MQSQQPQFVRFGQAPRGVIFCGSDDVGKTSALAVCCLFGGQLQQKRDYRGPIELLKGTQRVNADDVKWLF